MTDLRTLRDRRFRFTTGARLLHQALFSASVALATTTFFLYYLVDHLSDPYLHGNSAGYFTYWYFCLRAGVRINRLFNLQPQSVIGFSCAFLTATLALSLVFFLIVRVVERTNIGRVILDPVAPILIFGILPLGALVVTGIRPGVSDFDPGILQPVLLILLFFAILGGLFFLTRKWLFPLWLGSILLALYFGFFGWVFFGRYSWLIWRNLKEFAFLNLAFLFVGPLPGLAWMLYARIARRNATAAFAAKGLTNRTLAYSVTLLGLCFIPWLPARNHNISNPKDINSVAVKLSRGSCFGSCPIYTVTVHGTGLVEYDGQRFVGTKGLKTTIITTENVAKLLRSFDQAHFVSLDGDAFANCFDTPYATIGISVDGESKTVAGDDCYASSGPKAALQQLAKEIDDVTESSRWVKCERQNCWH